MKQKIEGESNRLINTLMKNQGSDGAWHYPFETGISTDCYMIILLRTLEIHDEQLIKLLVQRVLSKQEKNGAWKVFHDEDDGNLSLTVEAYYALMYAGYKTKDEPAMKLAEQFILKNGGLKKVHMFTKVMLALTGQYPWPHCFPLPVEMILLPAFFPINFFDLSIYARANLTPILIAAHNKFRIKTKHSPDLSHLFSERDFAEEQHDWEIHSREWKSIISTIQQSINKIKEMPKHLHNRALNQAEQYMLQRIEPDGTFYSYFGATFLMIFALRARGYPRNHSIIKRALNGLRAFITTIDGNLHVQYTTSTIWDTALISYVLQEAGVSYSSPTIQKANQYLLSKQHVLYGDWAVHAQNTLPGGWGFSHINTINPDIDDTTAALRSLRTLVINQPLYRQSWDRGIQWIFSMQNHDGGWPAFEKGVNSSLLALVPIDDASLFLLDPSTADLTGRTLEFFGNYTSLNKHYSPIKHSINWLLKNQKDDGSWYGRWGICYLYGTWGAVTGLIAAKVRKNHPSIQKAINWLHQIQNSDGGWGESCKSDSAKNYIPLNNSTSVQTAWALDTLIAAATEETPAIKRGIDFLLQSINENDWTKDYPKGQGLPGSFYIHYHSYEYFFPLLALSHYKKKFS